MTIGWVHVLVGSSSSACMRSPGLMAGIFMENNLLAHRQPGGAKMEALTKRVQHAHLLVLVLVDRVTTIRRSHSQCSSSHIQSSLHLHPLYRVLIILASAAGQQNIHYLHLRGIYVDRVHAEDPPVGIRFEFHHLGRHHHGAIYADGIIGCLEEQSVPAVYRFRTSC